MTQKSIQIEKKTSMSNYLVKTIFTSLLFFFAFTANLNAQCIPDPANDPTCDPTPQTMVVGGYTIVYFNCQSGIAISSITYQGLTTPGLGFIN